MKKFLIVSILGLSLTASANSAPKNPSAPSAPASPSAPSVPDSAYDEIEKFSQKKLTNADYPELQKNLKTVLLLDDQDPSREAVITLSESYNKNKALYDKALKSLETKKNKSQVKEIKKLLKSHYTEGNG